MINVLLHSAAEIVAQLLIDLAQGTLPSANGSWPVYDAAEPNTPDNAITVYDTTPQMQGRTQVDGVHQQHHGIQIRIRSQTHVIGNRKAEEVQATLDQTVYQNRVTLDGTTYIVQSIGRTSGIIPLGADSATSKRRAFTINGTVPITRL